MKYIKQMTVGLLLMVFLSMFFIAVIHPAQTIKKEDTVEIKATVLTIQTTGTKGNKFYLIYTKEHENGWYLNEMIEEQMKVLEQLQVGDEIAFRINRNSLAYLNKVQFEEIFSLKKENQQIFSVDDYNNCLKKQNRNAPMFGIPFWGAFFIYGCLMIKRRKKVRRS